MSDPTFDRNPLVTELRDSNHPVYRAACRDGQPPGLFGTSDLPFATASGNPPSQLLNLPWKLRHAAARADQAEWARLHAEFGRQVWEPGMEVLVGYENGVNDQGNYEYEGRVREWASGRPV